MTPLDAEERERLRRLLAKATPGPWRHAGGGYIEQLTDGGKGYPLNAYPDSTDVLDLQCHGDCAGCDGWHSLDDVELACDAVTALPALLDAADERDRLRQRVAELERRLQAIADSRENALDALRELHREFPEEPEP